MKRILSTLIAISLFYSTSVAQEFRLNGFAGYLFDDHVDSYYSATEYFEGTIKGGFRWGLGAEYMLHPQYGIGIIYYRQDTEAPMTYYDQGVKSRDFDLGCSWLMAAFTRYMKKDNIELYGGGELGAVFFGLDNSLSGSSESATKFAWGLNLGTNIFFSEKVGLKVQIDLHSASQAVGGGFYFGTGGAGTGVSSYSTIYQFGIGGGLVFRFPKK
ncbi:MAG TPA: hypothetical protein VFN95_17715 [Flavitalea sp.]|nr:hypothetical protein [Flavitalea sp.]